VKKIIVSVMVTLVVVVILVVVRSIPVNVPEKPAVWHVIEKDEGKDYFVFVIDHSLSIKEQEMGLVIRGVQRFVDSMPSKASASIVIFNEMIEHILPMTNDHAALTGRVQGIRPDGLSAFHDGLVKAIEVLKAYNGRRTVFFFTDGIDDRSSYKLDQVQKIAVSEGIKIYGVGIGDVDTDRLKAFSSATGGIFGRTKTYRSLVKVFPFMLEHYYDAVKNRSDKEGVLVIRSFPDNMNIYIDGVHEGVTPLRISTVAAGQHSVKVEFDKGRSTVYTVPVEAGKRSVVDFRVSGSGRNIILASMPGQAATFIDGTYVGMTGKFNKESLRENFRSALAIDSETLIAKNIDFGEHTVVFPGKPELSNGFGLDMGSGFRFDLNRSADDAVMVTVLYSKKIMQTNLKKYHALKVQ